MAVPPEATTAAKWASIRRCLGLLSLGWVRGVMMSGWGLRDGHARGSRRVSLALALALALALVLALEGLARSRSASIGQSGSGNTMKRGVLYNLSKGRREK